jgi:malate dehydrogenase
MGVISDENPYGVPAGLMFSFPVECCQGTWKIVPGLTITERVQQLIGATTEELQEERAQAGL